MWTLTWTQRVELILSTQEQGAAEFPGVDFLRGGGGRAQGEASSQEGLLLHGVGAGGLLEGRRGEHWSRLTPRPGQPGAWRWASCTRPGEGTRDTPESQGRVAGATVSYSQVPTQGTSQKWDEGPRGLRVTQGRLHGQAQAFQGPCQKPGPDQPCWKFGCHRCGRTPCPPGSALSRLCRTLDTVKWS